MNVLICETHSAQRPGRGVGETQRGCGPPETGMGGL